MPDLADLEAQLESIQWDIQYSEEDDELPYLKREEQFILGQINQERKHGLQLSDNEEGWDY